MSRRLNDRVGSLERHFQQAEKDIGDIRKSADAISSRGEKIEAVEMGEEDSAGALPEPPKKTGMAAK